LVYSREIIEMSTGLTRNCLSHGAVGKHLRA
jgi:hypothetical protein